MGYWASSPDNERVKQNGEMLQRPTSPIVEMHVKIKNIIILGLSV